MQILIMVICMSLHNFSVIGMFIKMHNSKIRKFMTIVHLFDSPKNTMNFIKILEIKKSLQLKRLNLVIKPEILNRIRKFSHMNYYPKSWFKIIFFVRFYTMKNDDFS